MSTGYHNPDGDNPNPEVDCEAQQAARNAIMEMPLFPDLSVALRKALGYGPHCEMVQHLIYWMHPRKKKMQTRWTIYKTYQEWQEECGLVRRQVDRGRKTLRALGLVTEKHGQYKRLHYRLDWVKLAEILNLYTKDVQYDDEEDDHEAWFDDSNLYTKGEQIESVHQGGQIEPPQSVHQGGQSNTGDYVSSRLLSEESLLQSAPEPSFEEPGANKMDKGKEQKHLEAQPITDNVSSSNGHARSTTTAGQGDGGGTVVAMMSPEPDDLALLAEIAEVLDPDSGKWWGAAYVEHSREHYKAEKVAKYIADDEELNYAGRAEELLPVVRYLMASRGTAA